MNNKGQCRILFLCVFCMGAIWLYIFMLYFSDLQCIHYRNLKSVKYEENICFCKEEM
jgi:hypothetical protein